MENISKNIRFSMTIFKCQYAGDWLLIGLVFITLFVGTILLRKVYLKKEYTFYHFLQQNICLMLITSTFLFVFTEIVLSLTKQSFTVNSIKEIAMWSKICYLVSYIAIAGVVTCALWMNRNWINKNNWYIFLSFLGPLIYVQQVLSSNISFSKFLNEKTTSYAKLALMFQKAHAQGMQINISLMNATDKPALMTMLLCLVLLLILGGVNIVFQVRKKAIKEIKNQ